MKRKTRLFASACRYVSVAETTRVRGVASTTSTTRLQMPGPGSKRNRSARGSSFGSAVWTQLGVLGQGASAPSRAPNVEGGDPPHATVEIAAAKPAAVTAHAGARQRRGLLT